MTDADTTDGDELQERGSSAFVAQVARYYRDFLETDFRKARAPSRQVRVRDENGSPLGFNVRRYPELLRVLFDELSNPFTDEVAIVVKRGQFTQSMSRNVQALLASQIDDLDDERLRSVVNACVFSLKKRASAGVEDFDSFVDDAQELVSERVMKEVVSPLITILESTLKRTASVNAEELVYEIEDDIAEHIVDSIRENLPGALIALIQSESLVPLATLLNDTIGPAALREFLLEFFSNLATGDAYEELLGLANTMRINESLQVYLYLLDLITGSHQFPIAYIPIQLDKVGDRFTLRFDNRLFFNRRAIKHVVDHNPESGLRVPGPPTNDRIHFLFESSPLGLLEDTILALTDAYRLPDRIQPFAQELQRSRIPLLTITNAVHVCAFQQGEEAIVNDYEEILVHSKEESSPLNELFDRLINGCILQEPKSIRGAVESRWDETPRDERLVYESPVPLNEEQRKLLLALQNDSCQYAVVEGPPGTGKSHTITAIVFDAIMRDRSVLVLSDKTEALDVVEDKLTKALNEIRPDENFQNPILRLGRSSGTYSKILSKATKERLQHFFTASRGHRARARKKLEEDTRKVKEDINLTVRNLASVDIQQILRYERLLADLSVSDVESLNLDKEFEEKLSAIVIAVSGLSDAARTELVQLAKEAEEAGNELTALVKRRILEAQATGVFGEKLRSLSQFESINVEHISWFKNVVDELIQMRNPIFGYLFKGAEVRALKEQLSEKMPLSGLQPPHKRRKVLQTAAGVLSTVCEKAAKSEIEEENLSRSLEKLRKGPVTSALDQKHLVLVRQRDDLSRTSAPIIEHLWNGEPKPSTWLQFEGAFKSRTEAIMEVVQLYNRLSETFAQVPALDLQKVQSGLQHEHTAELAHKLDGNVLDFVAEAGALATTLKSLIQQRKPFPKDRFRQLRRAFPCMIAGIREFADYIPLEPGLVDIVIIDEASQVSIAQALPALLRAKQVVVLGDEQQFANVKTSTASRAVNQSYMFDLERVFRENFRVDDERLQRMRSFDVRTSILKFFEFVKHFDVMLKKHFRGYSELISFSSKYFYRGGLQAIRIRARPVGEVICFSVLPEESLPAVTHRNANEIEAKFIHGELERLLRQDEPPTVGIISPFREQQKLLTKELLFDSPLGDDFKERLDLKIMTFDSCQGEERDVIYYSMASTEEHDRLNYIFPTELGNYEEGADRIKVQRLNVGFSRAKETIHFVLSKPVESYRGTVREVLRHYQKELENAKALPSVDQVDPNSPMEAQVLHWLRNTAFYQTNSEQLEIVPQFPIGDYLKQLDPYYEHPRYRVDFLLLYESPTGKKIPIIIEYDGFREHFKTGVQIDSSNYEYYYREEDVERQFVLESYGYNFLRVNRFNLGRDPLQTLSDRLFGLVAQKSDQSTTSEHIDAVNRMAKALAAGDAKLCGKCGKVKPLKEFRRPELKSGYGRHCNSCHRAAV